LVGTYDISAELLEPLARDHDNLHAALRWLLDQARSEDSQFVGTAVAEVWRQRGQLGEARALLGELLALTELEPSSARAGMLLLAGQLASYQGDFASARRLLEESVALCEALDLPAGEARAQGRLMEVDRAEGHYAAARARGTVMLPVAALADDPARPGFEASCRMWVALVDLAECDYAAAERETQQLLPVIEANGWTRVAGYALMALGMCAAERRDLHKAHALLEASLAR